MTEKRFELIERNDNGQADIIDWVESKEKNAICFYNDLGVLPYSSANYVCDLLNGLAEENQQLKIENVDLTLKNKQWEIFSEQSSYPFGSLLYLQAAAIPFKDIYFIEKEDSTKITIYVKPEYNKKEIKKFTEEHLPLGIDYEIFSIKEIRGDITEKTQNI